VDVVNGLENAVAAPELAGADGGDVAHPVQHLSSKQGAVVVRVLCKDNLGADDGGGLHRDGLQGRRLQRVSARGAEGGLFGTVFI